MLIPCEFDRLQRWSQDPAAGFQHPAISLGQKARGLRRNQNAPIRLLSQGAEPLPLVLRTVLRCRGNLHSIAELRPPFARTLLVDQAKNLDLLTSRKVRHEGREHGATLALPTGRLLRSHAIGT